MPLPKRVLIDDSAFLALLSADDTNHHIAVQHYKRLIDRDQELWVTSSVLIRITNWVYSRFGIEGLRIFKDSTEEIVHTFWIDGTTYQNALELMENTPTRSTLGLEESLVSVASSYLQAYVFTFNNCFSELGIPVIPR